MNKKRGRPRKVRTVKTVVMQPSEEKRYEQDERVTKSTAEEIWPWLKDCEYQGGTFYVMRTGYGYAPYYKRGTWIKGTWQCGTMVNCEFLNGRMLSSSYFDEGNWITGIFEGFRMYKTNWRDGIFNGGYFIKSNFFNGKFVHGIFEDSWWHEGLWGEHTIVRRTMGRKIQKYESIPKAMIVRKRKVNGKDRRDIQSESIKPKVKKREIKLTIKKEKIKPKIKKVKVKPKTVKVKPKKSKVKLKKSKVKIKKKIGSKRRKS